MDAKKKKIIGGIIAILAIIIILILLFKDRSNEKQFTIAFDTAGAGSIADIEVDKNGKITKPKDPVKEGYIFDGWYLNDEEFDFDTKITENIELEAKWSKATYTVTVKFNNGETINETVEYKDTLDLKTPTKEGYKFIGWYVDGKEFNLDTEITHNLTIEAKWEKITSNSTSKEKTENNKEENSQNTEVKTVKYVVEHYLMNTEGKYDKKPFETEQFTATINEIVKPKVKSYKGFVSPEEKEETITKNGVNVIKYYYERNKYNLSLNKDAGIAEIIGKAKEYYYDTEITITAKVKDGYTFAGWNNLSKTAEYKFKMPDQDLELNAKSLANKDTKYTVNYYLENIENEEYTLKDSKEFTGTTDTKVTAKLKDFDGFITPEAEELNIDGNGQAKVDYYYKRMTFNLNLEASEGIANVKGSNTYKFDSPVTIEATPQEGYEFIGWYNNDTLYSNESSLEINIKENLNLVAKAKAKEYKITFINDNIPVGNLTKKFKENISLEEILSLNKEGYNFLGWYLDQEYNNKFNLTQMPNYDLTLYAKWEVKPGTIVFYYNDEVYSVLEGKVGEPITEIPNEPQKDNYTFLGWYLKDSNEAYKFEEHTFEEKGIELYAKLYIITDIDKYIEQSITNKNSFTTNFNKNKGEVEVNITGIKELLTKTLSIFNNNSKIFKYEEIKDITVTLGEKEYIFTSKNYESMLQELLTDLTNTSDKEFSERTLSSLYNKSLKVIINLDEKISMQEDGKTSKEYTIKFTSNKVISKASFGNFGTNHLDLINGHYLPTEEDSYGHYFVTLNNDVINLEAYYGDHLVITSLAGSAVKTVMQNLLALNYMDHLDLDFATMDTVHVYPDNISDANFQDFGFSILPHFAKAIGKGTDLLGALTIKNKDLVPLEVRCTLVLKDDYVFEDGLPTILKIHFNVREDN